MGDSSDEYEQFDLGAQVPQGDELSRLYTGDGNRKGQSTSDNDSKQRYHVGPKVLPPISPAISGKKKSPPVKPRKTSGSGDTAQPSQKAKKYKKGNKTASAIPSLGPKPQTRMKTIEQQQRAKMAEVKRQRELGLLPPSRGTTSSLSEDFDEENIYEHMDPAMVPGEMTIEEFSVNFAKSLPQQIMVSKGVYGADDNSTLSTSDYCNVHFVKRRELVRLEEKGCRQFYNVPTNSAIKFAAVFNHHDPIEQIEKGERFPYVSNLLDLVLMPKVVCACQSYDTDPSDPAGVVDIREIMAIKEVIHPESPAQRRKLRVYSFTDCCDKVLDEQVYGHFSTKPADVKLYMTDILKHVSSPYPMHLLMFHDAKLKSLLSLPPHLFTYPLVMTKRFTEVILIATSAQPSDSQDDVEPFEIPTDIDIDIQLVRLPDPQQQQLIKATEELNEKMDKLSVKTFKYENVSEEAHRAQAKLYELVRLENGAENSKTKDSQVSSSQSRGSLSQRIEKLEKQNAKYLEEVNKMMSSHESFEQFREFIKSKMKEQSLTISSQSQLLKCATKQIASLRKEVHLLKKEIHGEESGDEESFSEIRDSQEEYDTEHVVDPRPEDVQGESALSPTDSFHGNCEENRKKLATMDTQQLVWSLRELGLTMYEDTFRREDITGELLLECTDEVLQNELGIKSKLHRIKMLRLIEGKQAFD